MAVAGVVPIARSTQIGRHQTDGIKAVLEPQRSQSLMPAILAMAYQALVGSRAPVSNVFLEWVALQTWVNAATAQK